MAVRERSFLQRNKPVQLRELTGVVARRAGPGAPAGTTLPGEEAALLAAEVAPAQRRAFAEAGWVFHARSGAAPEGAPVFLKPGGRLALGTDTLTVRLPDDPSEAQAAAVLQPYGCRVVERLRFAPGLFRVALTDAAGGDAIDVANALMAAGAVEFAEPELIEMVGAR